MSRSAWVCTEKKRMKIRNVISVRRPPMNEGGPVVTSSVWADVDGWDKSQEWMIYWCEWREFPGRRQIGRARDLLLQKSWHFLGVWHFLWPGTALPDTVPDTVHGIFVYYGRRHTAGHSVLPLSFRSFFFSSPNLPRSLVSSVAVHTKLIDYATRVLSDVGNWI